MNLSEEAILPDENDRELVADIKKLDSFITRRADYDGGRESLSPQAYLSLYPFLFVMDVGRGNRGLSSPI